MTAEIGILNKTAVALAADSAVTITNRRGEKIYNYANKLFYLSKYHPVGIMVYGNAELSGVPWETIIKVYRKVLDGKVFDTLEEYANDFFEFLQKKDNYLFTENTVNAGMENIVMNFLRKIRNQLIENMQVNFDEIDDIDDVDPEEILSFCDSYISERFDEFSNYNYLEHFSHEDVIRILAEKDQLIEELINWAFDGIPLRAEAKESLRMMTALYFCKDIFVNEYSGIVVAGFGELETFPSLFSYLVECKIGDKLKFRSDEQNKVEICEDRQGAVVPFAQDDMVKTILSGVDQDYENFSKNLLLELFSNYPHELMNILEEKMDLPQDVKAQILKEFVKMSAGLFNSHKDETQKYLYSNHVFPIYNTIEILPKEELASIAETLVNITSFKRKISAAAETVGGPVDVALITKGDGFIWIKRKHYFDPNLNQHFFSNYFRRDSND